MRCASRRFWSRSEEPSAEVIALSSVRRSVLQLLPGTVHRAHGPRYGASPRRANEAACEAGKSPHGVRKRAAAMVLSSAQHLLLAVSLALCACFLLPRMFGGRTPPGHGRPTAGESQGNHQSPRRMLEKGNHLDQIKGEMEKQLKTEKTGTSRSMAFSLMPMYAVGVALFAAYKFSKMKSNEKSRLKSSKDDEKKSKETENQLLELERHLSQTERMLNSLLTQLDPLSNCVNSLAVEQKDEIMNQLQSIRQLMKKSGMDKSTFNNSVNQHCEDTLEDLIHSFKNQNPGIPETNKENDISKFEGKDLDFSAHISISKEPAIQPEVSYCKADGSPLHEQDIAPRQTSDGLRKRNVKD